MSIEIAQYYKEEDQKQMSSNSFIRKRQNKLSAKKTSGFIQGRSEKRNLRMCKKILGHAQGRSEERIVQMLRREEEKAVSKSHHQVSKVSDVFDMNDFYDALEDIFELHETTQQQQVNCDVCECAMNPSDVGFTDDSGIALCLGCAFNVKANRELVVEVEEEKKTLYASDGVRRCHCCNVPEYDLIPGRCGELLCVDCMEDIYPSQQEQPWMFAYDQEVDEEKLIIDEDGNVEEKKTLYASDGVRRCHCCNVPEYDLIPGRCGELLCVDCVEDIYPSQQEQPWMFAYDQEVDEEKLIIDEDGNVVTMVEQWLSSRRRNNYIDISNGYITHDVIDVCLNCKYNAVCDGVNICEECDTIQDETLKTTCDSCENARFVGWYEECDECMYCINVYNSGN